MYTHSIQFSEYFLVLELAVVEGNILQDKLPISKVENHTSSKCPICHGRWNPVII